ncbi:ROK family glucokinase [Nocardioides salsibiostraticola]
MFIGVDVGGSKVLAAEVVDDGAVVRSARRSVRNPTIRRPDSRPESAVQVGPEAVRAAEDALTEAVVEVAGDRPVTAVGVSLAGVVDQAGEQVLYATHLPWRRDRVRERLSARWGVPVALENDANCAAVAEATYGVAVGADSCLLVTIGTGIGGAILRGGELMRGANGMAGEFGHQQVVPDGLRCECGLVGCWEQYASGNALERVARVALGSHLDGPEVTAAALAGDHVAREAFVAVGTWLGVGLANLVTVFDPSLVVVGGGVSQVGDLLLDPARAALERSVYAGSYRKLPPVLAASAGPAAGAVGAAVLARRLIETA